MDILDDYNKIRNEIFEYFGYKEDWRVLPFNDAREYYWYLEGSEEDGEVLFAETPELLADEEGGQYYSNTIYRQRHLPKWVYRGEDYTMICVDTHTDGNQFLQIFSNDKEWVG